MNDDLKKELDNHLKGITEIFFSIKDTYLIATRFTRPYNDSEFDYIKTDEHFSMVVFSLWKVAQIEICKLAFSSKSQHYNLVDLIKEFENEGKYKCDEITPEIIIKWKNKFSELEPIITDIRAMRDKSFAHTDKDRAARIEKIRVTISEFESVLGLIGVIIREIKLLVFEDTYLLETPLEEKPNLILPRLSYTLEMEKGDPELCKRLKGDFNKN